MTEMLPLFATAAKGTEVALRDELRSFRFRHVRADRGGVHFEGTMADAGRACLWSAIAVRILTRVGEGAATGGQELYDTVRAIDWTPHLTPKMTIAVSAVVRDSHLNHTQFIAQKTKDAIVDGQRDRGGERSSVDLADADLRVFVLIVRDKAQVFLDCSGDALHLRGYRTDVGVAPLKETLASAILGYSEWDRTSPLIDPMCGAGTIAIEAAMRARNIAPGILRKHFGFERWASHDATTRAAMTDLRAAAKAGATTECPPIDASDFDSRVLDLAKANAERAGVASSITLKNVRIGDLERRTGAGWLVTNPPYDERMRADDRVWSEISSGLYRVPDYNAVLLSGSPDLERAISQKPRFKIPLWNGTIECRLVGYGPR
ncbi:MAG: class I SAM-dependent RNA methyltransferase [Polyangiales bacterium]